MAKRTVNEKSHTVIRTVRQYSKGHISDENMKALVEIAEKYGRVKNEVYGRYSGISSVARITPGYEIKSELNADGAREKSGLPTVYFERAVFEALGDIRGMWEKTAKEIGRTAWKNKEFTDDDRQYIGLVISNKNFLDRVLNPERDGAAEEKLAKAAEKVNSKRLDGYIRRQVRKMLVKPKSVTSRMFSVDSRGYRYADGGIYLTLCKKGKRLFLPLTDKNIYNKEIRISIDEIRGRIVLLVPMERHIKSSAGSDGKKQSAGEESAVRLSIGKSIMLKTDKGNEYGTELENYQKPYAEYLYFKNRNRRMEAERLAVSKNISVIGSRKYEEKKHRLSERLHSYINSELNRFFETEKPESLILPKHPPSRPTTANGKVNYEISVWQRGYIEKRILEKAQERGIPVTRKYK